MFLANVSKQTKPRLLAGIHCLLEKQVICVIAHLFTQQLYLCSYVLITRKRKYKYLSLSNNSECSWLINVVASSIRPFIIASRIRILSSSECRLTEGAIPDSC